MAILVRDGLSFNINDGQVYNSFEHIDVTVSSKSSSLRLLVIYNPGKGKNKPPFSAFFEDFASLLESSIAIPGKLLITGDFNVHVDDCNDNEAKQFLNLLELCGLQQHIVGATHIKGHTLDLIIDRNDDDLVSSPSIHYGLPSDHYAVRCLINIARPGLSVKHVQSRRLRGVDSDAFLEDIRASSLISCPPSELEDLVTEYSKSLSGVIYKHAPIRKRTVTLRPHAP